jgi:hypothetical protein
MTSSLTEVHPFQRTRSALAEIVLAVVLVAAAPGCRPAGSPVHPERALSPCLDLPGAARASLRLAPDGDSLYWYEQVPFYGYRSAWPRDRVVRWGLGDDGPTPLFDVAGAPFRVLDDGRVVAAGDSGMVVWSGGVTELVSEHDQIDHLELVGEGASTAAIYAAAGAIWRQPLHRATAARLGAADALVAVEGDDVLVMNGEHLFAHSARPGSGVTPRQLAVPGGELIKVLGGQMIVRRDDGLALQGIAGGPARTVLPGDWFTYLAPDGVRAYRRTGTGTGARIEVAIVGPEGAVRLPDVLGAAAVSGAVRLKDGRVAYLVGFDIDGDGEVSISDEHDVCIGDGEHALTVPARTVPRRWVAAAPALDTLAAELGASSYRFAASGALPSLTFTGVRRSADRAARWRAARTAAGAVTELLAMSAIDVILEYDDGGRALSEWDARSGRRVAWAGVGAALVADPADYEVVVATDTLTRDDAGTVTCAGSVTNRTDHALAGLVVDCVGGDGDAPIPVFPTTVPPGHVARFSGTTAGDADGSLIASVHRPETATNLLTYDPSRAARHERIAAAAAEVVDRSRLTLWDWSGGVHVGVELWGPPDFIDYSDTARTMAAEIAYDVLARVDRAAWPGDAAAPLELTIRAGREVWTYDGKALTPGAPD